MHPFNHGHEYLREELLSFIGSKQMMSGVLWGEKEKGCLIVTSGGRHGKKAGYADEELEDGGWWYFGQGSTGNHLLTNPANRRLLEGTRSLLLFTTKEPNAAEIRARGNHRKMFSFRGEYNICGYDVVSPKDGTRKGDSLLRFHLIPTQGEVTRISSSGQNSLDDLFSLRNVFASKTLPGPAPSRISIKQYRVRSEAVRTYGLLRANGICEGCNTPAPFLDEQGIGFLEVHHIHRLADDGIDEPKNIAALCPNCHRRAHYSADKSIFRQLLVEATASIEESLINSRRTEATLPDMKPSNLPFIT